MDLNCSEQVSDSGQPLPPTFSVQAEAYLVAKGCVSLYDVTGIFDYMGWPIFLMDNQETKNEIISRLQQTHGNGPQWTPCNNVFHMTEQESLKYLVPQVSQRYQVNTLTRKCCDCVEGSGCYKADKTCPCAGTLYECFHIWRCQNTLIRDGIYPATYLAHTGINTLGLGVKAGQLIQAGTIIIPFMGRINNTNDTDNDNAFDLDNMRVVFPEINTLCVNPMPFGGHGQFINSCGEGEEPNCAFKVKRVGNSIAVVIVAKCEIQDNQWLTLNYDDDGNRYWTKRGITPITQAERNVHQDVPVEIPMPSSDPLTWTRPVGRDHGLVVPPVELSPPPSSGDFIRVFNK